jgi:hypothetical protein
MANYAKVDAVDEHGQRCHFMMPTMANIPDDIADEDIVEVETEIRRLRISESEAI